METLILFIFARVIKFIVWVIGWFIRRPKLIVRISQDDAGVIEGGLVFEVENQSDTITSLSTVVDVTFQTLKRKTVKMTFDVREQDRNLPPFEPKVFTASARSIQLERASSWFRCYTVEPTRGPAAYVRIKNASLEEMDISLYWVEMLWFKLTGDVRLKETSMTLDEYNARKRSQGPH